MLVVMMGGRVAEAQCCGDSSTGAQNDLERATELARQMVCRFGMSPRLGPLTFGRAASPTLLNGLLGGGEERNFSEDTARLIDAEVRDIVQQAHVRAEALVNERRELLERIATLLLEKETLERDELERLAAELPGHGRSDGSPRGERASPTPRVNPPPARA